MANIEHGVSAAQKLASAAAYTASGGLIIGDAFQWLNENAGAVGAICAVVTVLINWHYQRRPRK
jgi:hypothetical protein